jgi:hypothetical protein
VIEGIGPRYCPSIEDKITRFADKTAHQIFVEPEGLTTHELYPNGISTSLPFDVQVQIVRSIRGFENAHITREVKSHKSPAKRPKSAPFFSSSPIARIIVTGKSKKHLAPQTSGKRP